MPDSSNLSSHFDKLGGSVTSLKNEMSSYAKVISTLARENKAFETELDKLAHDFSITGQASRLFSTKLTSMEKSLRDQVKLARENDIVMKKLAVSYALVAFKVGDLHTKMEMGAKGIDKLASGFHKFTGYLGKGWGDLGNVTDELKKFNRETFELSRQMQNLGQKLNVDQLKNFGDKANLSHTQIATLTKKMIELGNFAGKPIEKIGNLAVLARDKFGGTPDVINDITNQFVQLDNMLPGLAEDLATVGSGGKSSVQNLGALLSMMRGMGASTRQLHILASAYANVGKEQKELVSYEEAVQARNKAVADSNLKMGKNAETSLIAIEKGMTKMIEIGDSLINKFKYVPLIFLSLKAVGISSASGIASAIKQAADTMAAFGMRTRAATQELNQMRNAASGAATATNNVGAGGGVGGGGGRGMMRMGGRALGAIGGVAALGMSAYQIAQSYSGGYKDGDTLAGAADEGISARKSRYSGIGGIVGGVAGGLIGGPAGMMVGGMLGNMAGEYLGQSGDDDRVKKMASSLDSVDIKAEKGDRIQSASDIYKIIKKQTDETAKLKAVQALLATGAANEKDIRSELGDELVDNVQKMEKNAKASKELSDSAVAMEETYNKSAKSLKMLADNYSKIASHAASIRDAFADNPLATGEAVYWTGVEAENLRKQADERERIRNLTRSFQTGSSMSGAVQDKITANLGALGIDDEDRDKLVGVMKELSKEASKALDIDISQEARSAAKQKEDSLKKQYDTLVESLGLRKKLEKIGLGESTAAANNLNKMNESSAQEQKMAAEAEARVASIRAANAEVESSVSKHTTEFKLLDKMKGLEQSRADLLGKTAAGYAAHFQGEKKVYDTIVKQIDVLRKVDAQTKQNSANIVKSISGKADGLNEGLLQRVIKNDTEAVQEFERIKQDLVKKGDTSSLKLVGEMDKLVANQNKQIENEQTLLSLRNQQVEKALALREGYIDVINEMTTGSDMVSQLVADGNRGIVSLHQAQMQARGDAFGGATTRGFLSVDPFAGSMNMAGAAGYGPQGFRGPGSMANTALGQHLKQLGVDVSSERRAGGPGTFGNVDPGKSDMFDPKGGVRLASGGRIPGHSSSTDNRLGIIDGKDPIKVASGEYVVNAKATAENLSLLESINNGYAKGTTDGPIGARRAAIERSRAAKRSIIRGRFDKRAQKEAESEAWADEMGANLLSAGKKIGKGALAVAIAGALVGPMIAGWGGKTLQRNVKRKRYSPDDDATFERFDNSEATLKKERECAAAMSLVFGESSRRRDEHKRNNKFAAISQIQSELDRRLKGVDMTKTVDGGMLKKAREKLSSMGISDEAMAHRLAMANTLTAKSKNMAIREKAMEVRVNAMKKIFAPYHKSHERAFDEARDEADFVRKHGLGWERVKGGKQLSLEERAQRKHDINESIRLENEAARERNKKQMGLETGGLVSSSAALNAMSIAGGMRIGTLMLNGKVIGQDVNGGLGSEWNIAAQNAYG